MRRLSPALFLFGALTACSGTFSGKDDNPEGKGSDTDADADADADTDTDSDTDADTDTDPDPDTVDDDGDGLSEEDGDCDDTSSDISPDNDEVPYDGIDNDCDESTPDDDLDGDGVGVEDDCDDNDADLSPDNTETPYDGIDNDCDPSTPDDDLDGDGANLADDCDDDDDDIGPHVDEIPYDGIDNDCDESTADDDIDKDGYLLDDDCDDTDPLVYPGADEDTTNGVDDDCDGLTDERFDYVTVDSTCDCGAPSAIATDSAGQVWLAYHDNDLGEIKVDLRTTGGTWTGASTLSVTSGYEVGDFMDAEVDSADYFQLAYTAEDTTTGYMSLDFQYADPSGTWSGDFEVDGYYTSGSAYVGYYVDLDIDSSNLPTFGYYDASVNYPYVADYSSFGVGIYAPADYLAFSTSDYIGIYTALAVDSSDYAHIAFYDGASPYGIGSQPENQYSTFDLSLGDSCFSSTIDDDGAYNTMDIKSDDTVCVAYQDAGSSDLKYACNSGSSCSGWTIETVATAGAVGEFASLKFNSADEPYIAYYDTTNGRLMMAHDDGTGFTTFVVDESADVGQYADLAIDPFDNVHVSYYDADSMALKYATGM